MPKITAIIPTFNRERYVTRAVASILNQTFRDYEIVVVDDGSTDGTCAALQRYENAIRYIYQPNQGVSAARNAGIRVAAGEWLAFLDSDDEWRKDYLSVQMQYADINPRVCMQSTDASVIDTDNHRRSYFHLNGSIKEFRGRGEYLLVNNPFSFILRHLPWATQSTIVRRHVVVDAGLFDVDLRLSEDCELMARVGLMGCFGLIRKNLVNVFRRPESIESLTVQARRRPIEARKMNERVYEKLLSLKGVTAAERRTARQLISANRRAIGNLLLEQGDRKGAEEAYARAMLIYPCVRSVAKYALHRAAYLFHRPGSAAPNFE